MYAPVAQLDPSDDFCVLDGVHLGGVDEESPGPSEMAPSSSSSSSSSRFHVRRRGAAALLLLVGSLASCLLLWAGPSGGDLAVFWASLSRRKPPFRPQATAEEGTGGDEDTAAATNSSSSPSADDSSQQSFSVLLPDPLALWREGENHEIRERYGGRFGKSFEKPGRSCRDPMRQNCVRRVRNYHKMGYELVRDVLSRWEGEAAGRDVPMFSTKGEGPNASLLAQYPRKDFREVHVTRNIYQSLVSGYLYHKSGRECWLDDKGRPINGGGKGDKDGTPFTRTIWRDALSYEIPSSSPSSLCSYLANSSEEEGLRAYIEAVFQYYYKPFYIDFSLSSAVPILKDRVSHVCFEDLASDDSAAKAAAQGQMLDFLYNTTDARAALLDGGHRRAAYEGGHATSHDPALRERLIGVIQRLDEEHYKGDIAWLNETMPC